MATTSIYCRESEFIMFNRGTSVPQSLGISLDAGTYINSISFDIVSGRRYWYMPQHSNGTNYNFNIYLCDSAGNNICPIGVCNIPGNNISWGNSNFAKTAITIDGSALAGKDVYIAASGGPTDSTFILRNDYWNYYITVTYTTSNVSVCGEPSHVTVGRTRNNLTLTWGSGSAGGAGNPVASYGVIRNNTASETGATTIASSSDGSAITETLGQGTYYYGVRTQGTAGASFYSAYKWSSGITIPAKPSVSAGDYITKSQMDALKNWINNSGISSVTQYERATAAEGNTYRGGLTANDTSIDDSWYNAAADG